MFYHAILNGKVELYFLDESKHSQLCTDKFWSKLFANCFNTKEEIDILTDIICFIDQMLKTHATNKTSIGIEDLITKGGRTIDQNDDEYWQSTLLSVLRNNRKHSRIRNVRKCARIMLENSISTQSRNH